MSRLHCLLGNWSDGDRVKRNSDGSHTDSHCNMDSVSFGVFMQRHPGTGQCRLFSRQLKYSFGQQERGPGRDADVGTRCCARLLDF